MSDVRWSVVLPCYNEQAFLRRTVGSLLAQVVPVRLILVDNGSTDDTAALAAALLREAGTDGVVLREARPGQVHALERGLAAVTTEFVAVCDADTFYPPDYLAEAERLLDGGAVAAAACNLPEHGGRLSRALTRLHKLTAARLMPRQNHTGGGCHCFRTDALRAAGGYSGERWPYVLKDHELMHQVLKRGALAWSGRLWCVPSERRANRRGVRWTLAERLRYHLTPFAAKDAFFHDFLAPRLAARGMADTCLRQHPWELASPPLPIAS